MAKIAEARRDPGRVVEVLQDCGSKHWCKRAMMQEPHCLNTSILDCSVTFTVDKDVWIHGIEVPSQVTDVPEQLTVSMHSFCYDFIWPHPSLKVYNPLWKACQ